MQKANIENQFEARFNETASQCHSMKGVRHLRSAISTPQAAYSNQTAAGSFNPRNGKPSKNKKTPEPDTKRDRKKNFSLFLCSFGALLLSSVSSSSSVQNNFSLLYRVENSSTSYSAFPLKTQEQFTRNSSAVSAKR